MADGSIKISIEVDGKEVQVASKELDKLERSGSSVGKGVKAAESSISSLSDSSAKAGKDVKGTADSIDGLADSGSKASKDLKGTDSAIDGISDSSASATKDIKGTADSIDHLSDSGAEAGKSLKGTDGAIDNIADSSADATSSVKDVGDSLEQVGDKANKSSGELDKAGKGTDDLGKKAPKASISLKDLAISLGLVAVASAAWDAMKSSMDSAIARFDTFNTFPQVLSALGVSAEEAERGMNKLSDGTDGLPTKLDEIATVAQRMYSSFKDMDKAADTAVALNNAMLGSGSSTADAARGTEQYIQALQKGKFEMDEWKTLQETMGVGLEKVAEELGYVGKTSLQQLYSALKDGEISMDQFNDKLIEVGTGTGIMAKLAKENSQGLATSMTNLGTSVGRGVANIITSFDRLSQEVTGKNIAQNIDSLKVVINASFGAIQSVIDASIPVVVAFANAVKFTMPLVSALSPLLIGLASAYAANMIINSLSTAMMNNAKIITTLTVIKNAATLATNRLAVTMALAAVKAKLVGLALTAYNKITMLTVTAQTLMTSGMTLASVASVALSGAMGLLGTAIRTLLGPVGWATAALGLLAGGVIAVVKWFNKASEEGAKLSKDTEKLAESTNSLTDAMEETSIGYEKSVKSAENNAEANRIALQSIESLMSAEKLSKTEKDELNAHVESLNGSIDGLNLAYGEEANALNMTSEQISNRIDLMEKQEKLTASQKRLTEIIQEQMELEGQLAEVNELREEWNNKLEEGTVKGREHKKALKELEEQEETLNEAVKASAEQQVQAKSDIKEASEAVTEAESQNIGRMKLMYEELNETQKTAIDGMSESWSSYAEAATDMFDTLSEKSTVSVAEMTKNMEENQRIIGNWSENIAKLAERGVDEGLLETLRAAGPSSAGHVNALVKASDKELEGLSTAFSKGGEVANKALATSLGVDDEVLSSIEHLVTDTEATLSQLIKGANFKGIGEDIAKGQAEGITKGAPESAKAAEKMADDTTKAAKKALDSHSPSRVFKQIGIDITDGLSLGINDGTNKVQQAITKMLDGVMKDSKSSFDKITKDHEKAVSDIEKTLKKLPKIAQETMKSQLNALKSGTSSQVQVMRKLSVDILAPFKSTPAQFRSIGVNAMAGMNAGLNAGSGSVLSTARRIANAAAATMKKALKIHSPSRLFRDDIGKMIPAGVAVGIEDNAGIVYKALNSMMQGMTVGSPEMALGGGYKMMGANMGSNIVQNSTSSTTNNHTDVNMQGIFNGATFNVRSDNDIKQIAKELNDYIRDRGRSKGVVIP